MPIDHEELQKAVEHSKMLSDITAALAIANKARDDLTAFKESAQREKEHFLRWGITTLLVILGAAAVATLNFLLTGRVKL